MEIRKQSGASMFVWIGVLSALSVILLPVPTWGKPNTWTEQFAEQHDVKVSVTNRSTWFESADGVVQCDPVDAEALERYVPILQSELSLYSSRFLRSINFKQLTLCGALHADGDPVRGVTVLNMGRVYLSALATYSEVHLKTPIHHEIFHLMDWDHEGMWDDDPQWNRINRGGFRYASQSDASSSQRKTQSRQTAALGFVTHYSKASPKEDRAELFAELVVNYPAVVGQAEHDAVLRSKINHLKRVVQRFGGGMGGPFWERVRKRQQAP